MTAVHEVASVARPLTKAEAAALLRCSPKTVQRRVAAGKLRHIRDDGRLLFLPEFIAEYFASKTENAAPRQNKPARNPKYL